MDFAQEPMPPEWRLEAAENIMLAASVRTLRLDGWAASISVVGLRDTWREFASNVQAYNFEIYVESLYARKALYIFANMSPSDLRDKIEAALERDDNRFLAATREATCLIDEDAVAEGEWWWYRCPPNWATA